jgi:hypothetical protein
LDLKDNLHLIEFGAEEPVDLLDEDVGGEEGVVLLGPSFHLHVLVVLLLVVGGHEVDGLLEGPGAV